MKKFYDIAPFVMLVITAVSGMYSGTGQYKIIFKHLPDILGYSIFTNLVMLRVYRSPKFCYTTRFAVYGLIGMNLVSLITIDTKYYNTLHDTYIAFITLSVVYYLYLKK